MAKVGVQIGEEFPAEEAGERPQEDCIGRDHEEWRRHAEWRAKARAFKDDVRRAARKHFGDHAFVAHNMIVMRAVVAVLILALLIALLPRLLLLGILLAVVAFVVLQRQRLQHQRFDLPGSEF